MPRGTSRQGGGRRARGSHRATTNRGEQDSRIPRVLPARAIGPRGVPTDLRNKFKKTFAGSQERAVSSCLVSLPGEKQIKELSKKFVRTYYEIFDQPGRANLENLYHSDALFSFSSTHPMPVLGRNLIAVRDPCERLSMLVFEKTNIARTLASFTATEHLVNQFTSDVSYCLANPMAITCLQIVVTGLFKDTKETIDPLRAFTRIFVIKHTSTDEKGEPVYQIFNDMFMLQVPTGDQIKKYNQETQALRKYNQNQQQLRSTNSTHTASQAGLLKRREEQQMESVMSKTQLTREGAQTLLSENHWNEESALEMYNRLLPLHKIPPELFRK